MSSGGGGAEGGAAGKKKSSSIYCFFYGTRYIQDIVKNLDWHHRTSLRAALRCYGRVFVGPTYLPALRPCKVYSMHVELPVKELEALLQRLKLEKQLTAVPSGDKSRARGDKMVLHSFAATLDAQRPPVGHRNPNPDENTSGILVKVTAAELEQIVKLRSKNLEHFEEKVMTIDTKPRATRVAHIWQPKPPHDWVEVPADKILATAENGDKFVDFGKHVKACASFMYDFRLSEKKTDIRDFDFVPRGYFYCSKGADGKKRYKAGIYATKNEASTGAGAARAFVQAPVPGPAPAPAPVPAPARAPAPVSSPALAQKKPADWLALVAKKERELDQKIQAKESVIKSSLAQFNVKVQNALRDLVEEQKLLGDFDAGNVMNSNNKRNSALVAADRGDETEEDVVSREADAYVGAQKEWLESAQSGARCRFGRVQKCFDALGFLEDDGFGHVQSLLQFRSVDAFWMNRRGLNSNGSGDDQDDDDEEVFDVDIRVTAHEPTGVVSLEIIAERMMYVGRSIQSEVVHLVDCALSKETSVFEHSSVVGHSCGAENRRFIEICDLNGESLDEWMPDPDLLELDATPLEPHVGPTSPRFNSKEQLKRQRQRQAFLRFHPSFTVENKPLVVGPLQSKQARQLVAVVDAASSSVAPHQRLLYMQRALSIRSIALAEPSMWRENRGDFLVWHNAGSAEVEVVFSPTASVIGQHQSLERIIGRGSCVSVCAWNGGIANDSNATYSVPVDAGAKLGANVEEEGWGDDRVLQVVEVKPDSLAARAGAAVGDILLSVNGMSCQTDQALDDAMDVHRGNREYVFERRMALRFEPTLGAEESMLVGPFSLASVNTIIKLSKAAVSETDESKQASAKFENNDAAVTAAAIRLGGVTSGSNAVDNSHEHSADRIRKLGFRGIDILQGDVWRTALATAAVHGDSRVADGR